MIHQINLSYMFIPYVEDVYSAVRQFVLVNSCQFCCDKRPFQHRITMFYQTIFYIYYIFKIYQMWEWKWQKFKCDWYIKVMWFTIPITWSIDRPNRSCDVSYHKTCYHSANYKNRSECNILWYILIPESAVGILIS